MCEFTKTVKNSEGSVDRNTTRVSEAGTVIKFLIRLASLFMVYFLLDSHFNFINCAVCLFLLMTELYDVISEK
ncbi:MAG: hypothetical protein J6A69_11710 [Clostridia bacterium]|nr:hypothetical protein [Clostridia bacterium]